MDQIEEFPGVVEQLMLDFIDFLPNLVAAIVVFLVGLYLANLAARLVSQGLERREVDPGANRALTLMTRWGLIILVAVTALQQVNFNLTAFVAGLGIAGFTIGFALKDISANFISGLLLLLQKPFAIGDVVQIDEFRGRVTDVSLRATEIETMDGHNLILPNETVYMSPILNYSRSRLSRIAVDVGVAYDTDLEHAEEVALSTVSALPLVLKDPEPSVTFHTFGDSSINFTIFYWIDNRTTSLFQASDLAVPALKRAFEEANIEIPFPVRTVYMSQAT